MNGLTRPKDSYLIDQESILIHPPNLSRESNITLSSITYRKRDFQRWVERVSNALISRRLTFPFQLLVLNFQRDLHRFQDLFSRSSLISLIICGPIVLEAI